MKKISSPIVFFSFYMALMLFQTSSGNMGTILALVTIAGTIVTAFFSKKVLINHFRLPIESALLLAFISIVGMTTLLRNMSVGDYIKLLAQILLCIIMHAMFVSSYQRHYIYWIFILSVTFYAICAIYSCIKMAGIRYVHSSIVILGTPIDPNFLGIPFVAGTVLLLNNVLNKKKTIISIFAYMVVVVAIVFTSSRSNLICWIISNGLLLVFYLSNNKVYRIQKLIYMILILVVAYLMFRYLSTSFSEQLERMTSFGDGSDNGRIELWERAIEAWENAPLFGHGIQGMYRIYGKATHNTYLQLLSETGIVGVLLMVGYLLNVLLKTFKSEKVYFCVMIGLMIQISFLDALDNRCVWVILSWFALLPKEKKLQNKN